VLVLVPTELESGLLFPDGPPAPLAVCGFGLAAAGAGAAHAIAEHRAAAEDGVVLVGAAGAYDTSRHPIGTAVRAGSVRCDGIGAGSGDGYRSAAELGFAAAGAIVLGQGPELLSVATAAGSTAEAADRQSRYPAAAGEEMEGYAVAVAAWLFGVDLTIVRGFSNAAGDRDHAGWRMDEALGRAAALVRGLAR
jgi:futalosine hydrolase